MLCLQIFRDCPLKKKLVFENLQHVQINNEGNKLPFLPKKEANEIIWYVTDFMFSFFLPKNH
jgi:hypothetical protein